MTADDKLVPVGGLLVGEAVDGHVVQIQYVCLLDRRTSVSITEWNLYAAANAFLTGAGEHPSTRAICLNPAPSSVIRRHCSSFSPFSAGGLPTLLPSALARSKPSLIRLLSESTWKAPWANMDRRKNLAAAPPSRVSMFSLMATIPMSWRVRSAWILTPSSKFRLNRSRKATVTVSPGCRTSTSACQPGRCRERPLATSGEDQVVPDPVVGQNA